MKRQVKCFNTPTTIYFLINELLIRGGNAIHDLLGEVLSFVQHFNTNYYGLGDNLINQL